MGKADRDRELPAFVVERVAVRTVHAIFGSPDDFKFRSCMTLFGFAAPNDDVFAQALDKYFGGEPDPRTVALLPS